MANENSGTPPIGGFLVPIETFGDEQSGPYRDHTEPERLPDPALRLHRNLDVISSNRRRFVRLLGKRACTDCPAIRMRLALYTTLQQLTEAGEVVPPELASAHDENMGWARSIAPYIGSCAGRLVQGVATQAPDKSTFVLPVDTCGAVAAQEAVGSEQETIQRVGPVDVRQTFAV